MATDPCIVNRKFGTWIDVLSWRSRYQASETAYTYLLDGESLEESLSYHELELRARAIAAMLQDMRCERERILLLFPPGLDYVAAFLGCLYAGAIAVPIYPPDPGRIERTLPRIQIIAHDAQVAAALTTSSILTFSDSLLNVAPELKSIRWLATDNIPTEVAGSWRSPDISANSIAFLQYTSGSTGSPKGVQLTHANLLWNSSLIHQRFENTAESRAVIWLPPYHDMGLIGGILQPLYTGHRVILMSPIAFLQRPVRWLQAISRFRGTISGGPNFAYDLCERKTTLDEISKLDLRDWSVAFNGAEPIRRETIYRFAAKFEPCGFRREAFYPCYGLAEATLLVSGSVKGQGPVFRYFDQGALKNQCAAEVTDADLSAHPLVGCGRSNVAQRILIVAPDTLLELPPGRVGEIWISDPSVAQGYWNQPDETRRVFQAFLSDTGAGPFLRTGDLGFVHDGELFVTSRLKDLIIIRGINHYPQDVEVTAEESHPALRKGCGAAFSIDVNGEERLVIVQEVDSATCTESKEAMEAIRQAVAEKYQVQVFAIGLIKPRTIPKTSSGKIQRSACRQAFLNRSLEIIDQSVFDYPSESEAGPEQSGEFLQTESRQQKTDFVKNYLRRHLASLVHVPVEKIDFHKPVSAFGLDSLTAVEMSELITENLNIELSAVDLLRGPSLSQLASRIIEKWSTGQGEREAGSESASADRITLSVPPSAFKGSHRRELSFAQQRLWFLNQLMPDNPFYNVPLAIRLDGPLDAAALEESLAAIIRRHEALRTIFRLIDGSPVPIVLQELHRSFRFLDLVGVLETERESRAQQMASDEARKPFDLGRGPLLRALLMKMDRDRHILLITMHHIACDGWSMNILLRELAHFYHAITSSSVPALPELPLQYGEFACWQQHWLGSESFNAQLSYWKTQMADSLPLLSLPLDRPRPAVQLFRGARCSITLPQLLVRSLKTLAWRQEATPFMVLLAALKTLLYRYSAQSDICVGVAIHNRNWPETKNLIGFFANTLVLRSDLSGDPTFLSMLRRLRGICLDAYTHQDLPFEKLVESLRPQRDLSYSPIFQVMFVYHNEIDDTPGRSLAPGLSMDRLPALEDTGSSKRDLAFHLMEISSGGMTGFIEYDLDLFNPDTIARMADHFNNLLADIARDAGRPLSALSLLSEIERRIIMADSQRAVSKEPVDGGIQSLFERQVEHLPDSIAVLCEDEAITYRRLNSQANHLANYLRSLGVKAEDRIGLYVDRSLAMVIGILGILKSGAAYVPLDPAYPKDRVNFILNDSGVKMLLTQSDLATTCIEADRRPVYLDMDWPVISRQSEANPEPAISAGNLAYLIYTSGSTGNPKGAMVTHANLCHYAQSLGRELGIRTDDRYLHTASIAFSSSVRQLMIPLCCGSAVVIAGTEATRNPTALLRSIKEVQVTVIDLIPSYWRNCIRVLRELQPVEREDLLDNGLRLVLSASEPLSPETPASWRAHLKRPMRLINMFGQTETAGIVALYRIPDHWPYALNETSRSMPIGSAIAGAGVYVLDSFLEPAPIGHSGDMYVAGGGVSRGYFNRPELTAETFIPNPFGSGAGYGDCLRLFRTGDRGRLLAEGHIEHLGRSDHQVKIRGYRIELGEIESALRRYDRVEEATVTVREEAPGNPCLIAYVAGKEPGLTSANLRRHLKALLPDYMVPPVFVILSRIPRAPNGKIDFGALPPPIVSRSDLEEQYTPPRSPEEETVSAIWSNILGVERIGIHDNFFELGGHSLTATQVISRIRAEFGIELSVRTLFEEPTVEGLARAIKSPSAPAGEVETIHIEPLPRGAKSLSELLTEIEAGASNGPPELA